MIDLRPDHLEIVRDLLRQHVPGCEVRAFGSRFKWTAKEASDLDLAVVGSKRLPAKKIMRLKEAFEESILPMRVDVLDWHTITSEFKRVIEEGYEVIQGGEVSPLAPASSPSAAGSSATPLTKSPATSVDQSNEYTWEEIVSLEYGKALRDYKNSCGHYRVYGANGPVGWSNQRLAKGPGVILGRKGAYRGVEYSASDFYVIDTAYYLKPKIEIDMRWLYYAVIFHKLGEIDDGSPIPSTTRSAVYVRKVCVPSIATQKAIANILGALDDRIELCRNMNETLESMVQALFKDWFIDFGPVRSKMQGRAPYLSADVWSLFPDHLVDSELGEIPEGWSTTTWGSLITLEYGKSLRDYRDNNGVIRVYGTNGPIGFCDKPLCETAGVIIGRKGAYRGIHYSPEPFFAIDTAFYLKPKNPMSILWAYYELKQLDINGMDSGSAIPSTSRPDFYGISVVEPSQDVQRAFESSARQFYNRITDNNRNIETYSTLRDSLLPKLLSGELPVNQIQGFDGV